jgi:membrane protein DedA with SNARE-associated domain
MDPSLTEVVQWLLYYKYFVLFPIMVVEGPIITIIAGFLVSLGHLNGLAAYAVLVAGDVTGDSIYSSFSFMQDNVPGGSYSRSPAPLIFL